MTGAIIGMGTLLKDPEVKRLIDQAQREAWGPLIEYTNEGEALARGSRRGLTDQLSALSDVANMKGLSGDVTEARARAEGASARDEAQFTRRTSGLDLSARQKAAAAKRFSLSRALNRADAAGRTRMNAVDAAKGARMAGGGFADALRTDRVNTATDLGSAFAAEVAARRREEANEKAGWTSLMGNLIGAGVGFAIGGPVGGAIGAGATGD